jgi:hypothetical protein
MPHDRQKRSFRIMNRLAIWIIGVVVATSALGTVYLVAQQLDRQAADQVGAQLATQVAGDLSSGSTATVDGLPRVDLAASLAPFVVVYDSSGHPVAGNGYLDGRLAEPPAGVIATAASEGSNHVTWQPRPGLRFATVEVRSGDRVVMGAQSLIPTEQRADRLGMLVALAWIGTMFAIALIAAAFWWVERAQAARGTRPSR